MENQQATINDIMVVLHKQQEILLNQQREQKDIFQNLQKQNDNHIDLMSFLEEHMVVKEEFNGVKDEVHGLRDQVQTIDSRVQNLDSRVQTLEVKVNQVKLDLIDAMDEKMAALRGDLVILLRGEDKKLTSLIEIMKKKNLLDDKEAQALLALPPFPRLSL